MLHYHPVVKAPNCMSCWHELGWDCVSKDVVSFSYTSLSEEIVRPSYMGADRSKVFCVTFHAVRGQGTPLLSWVAQPFLIPLTAFYRYSCMVSPSRDCVGTPSYLPVLFSTANFTFLVVNQHRFVVDQLEADKFSCALIPCRGTQWS